MISMGLNGGAAGVDTRSLHYQELKSRIHHNNRGILVNGKSKNSNQFLPVTYSSFHVFASIVIWFVPRTFRLIIIAFY